MYEDDIAAGFFHAGFYDLRNSATLSVSNDSQLRELSRQFLSGFFGVIGGTVIHDQHFERRRQFRQNVQQFRHLPLRRISVPVESRLLGETPDLCASGRLHQEQRARRLESQLILAA